MTSAFMCLRLSLLSPSSTHMSTWLTKYAWSCVCCMFRALHLLRRMWGTA